MLLHGPVSEPWLSVLRVCAHLLLPGNENRDHRLPYALASPFPGTKHFSAGHCIMDEANAFWDLFVSLADKTLTGH